MRQNYPDIEMQIETDMTKLKDIPADDAPGWLAELDGRTTIAQTMRARFNEFTSDLGGAAQLTYAQRSLVERALWLEYWLRQEEQKLAAGAEGFDSGRWAQACNTLLGLLRVLGLERKAKDVPDLGEFLRKRQQQEAR